MNRRPFAPDFFALAILALGLLFLLFPLMRVATLIAVTAAVAYWLIIGLLWSRRARRQFPQWVESEVR
jgi:hypothetical protein